MAQLMQLSLASVKSRLVLPFWYRLTWVVLEKGALDGCVRVCVGNVAHCYSPVSQVSVQISNNADTSRPAVVDKVFDDFDELFLKQCQLDPEELAASLSATTR